MPTPFFCYYTIGAISETDKLGFVKHRVLRSAAEVRARNVREGTSLKDMELQYETMIPPMDVERGWGADYSINDAIKFFEDNMQYSHASRRNHVYAMKQYNFFWSKYGHEYPGEQKLPLTTPKTRGFLLHLCLQLNRTPRVALQTMHALNTHISFQYKLPRFDTRLVSGGFSAAIGRLLIPVDVKHSPVFMPAHLDALEDSVDADTHEGITFLTWMRMQRLVGMRPVSVEELRWQNVTLVINKDASGTCKWSWCIYTK